MGLVVLVVLLFLRTIRATIIAGVALPVSLVATFGVMWFCGFSLDNLSLMALTIGTGFVVDDAIVMIENIVRHMEKGESPMQAALKGASEIGFTVISLTLSLIAVFIPLLFMTGLVGRMFREFALTLTIAVVISAVVSLTLTPMMCSRMLRHGSGAGASPLAQYLNGLVDRVVAGYHRTLLVVLRHERATLLTTVATLVITIGLYVIVPKGFLPLQDTGLVQAVMEAGPEVSFTEMVKLQDAVADAIRTDPDVAGVVSIVGVSALNTTPNAGHLKITLKPRDARKANVTAIIDRLKEKIGAIPGITVYFQPVQDVQISTRISRAQFQYTLVGSDEKDVAIWSRPPHRDACAPRRCCARWCRRPRTGACAPWCRSTARRPGASASPCRPSTMRSTTPSASARSRPSTPRPTSTAWCSRRRRSTRATRPRCRGSTSRPPAAHRCP